MVGTYYTTKYVFDMKDTDVHWCTADPGWITGQSYLIGAPLSMGMTSIVHEGSPLFPHAGRFSSIIAATRPIAMPRMNSDVGRYHLPPKPD